MVTQQRQSRSAGLVEGDVEYYVYECIHCGEDVLEEDAVPIGVGSGEVTKKRRSTYDGKTKVTLKTKYEHDLFACQYCAETHYAAATSALSEFDANKWAYVTDRAYSLRGLAIIAVLGGGIAALNLLNLSPGAKESPSVVAVLDVLVIAAAVTLCLALGVVSLEGDA